MTGKPYCWEHGCLEEYCEEMTMKEHQSDDQLLEREVATFVIERISGPREYLITVRESGQVTDIYEFPRQSMPWLVKKLLRRGCIPAGKANG